MKRHNRVMSALAVAAALLVAGCGGGSDNPAPPSYARLVSFGDSLSDVGTYHLGSIAAQGGGQFTVNDYSPNRPKAGTNWTEQLAYELALPAPCAARIAPPTPATPCTNWAQGGARVTEESAPVATGLFPPEPVVKQVQNFLAAQGSFAATDLVTVMAGGNDVFAELAKLSAGSTTAAQAGAALQAAGAALAGLVKTQLLDKGAQRVVVVLVPDVGTSALVSRQPPEQRPQFAQQLSQLSLAFNVPLLNGLAGDPRVLVADAFTASELQKLDPAKYGLSNATTPACDIDKIPGASSLLCSAATLRQGADAHYWLADAVHPTPYGYQLLARVVTDTMTRAGWLAPWGSRPCDTQAQGCTLAPLPQ